MKETLRTMRLSDEDWGHAEDLAQLLKTSRSGIVRSLLRGVWSRIFREDGSLRPPAETKAALEFLEPRK